MIKILFFIFMMYISTANSKTFMIAHAGGGINDQNYSNSLEALDANYAKGFRTFEIDFSWTSDKQLVCLHDWKKSFKKVFGYKVKNPLNYKEFQQALKDTDGLHPCTIETFAQWVLNHPNVKIVTDVKYNNVDAIKKIIKSYPNLQNQLIVQFYQPEEYNVLKDMGFEKLIWILYQYKGSFKSVAKHVESMELFALSMRASQAKKKIIQNLQKEGVNIFVYTINKERKVNILVNNYNVSGVYTDFLLP